MKERIITNNSNEKITIKWDGTRFALIREEKDGIDNFKGVATLKIILLNLREMQDLVEFVGKNNGKV